MSLREAPPRKIAATSGEDQQVHSASERGDGVMDSPPDQPFTINARSIRHAGSFMCAAWKRCKTYAERANRAEPGSGRFTIELADEDDDELVDCSFCLHELRKRDDQQTGHSRKRKSRPGNDPWPEDDQDDDHDHDVVVEDARNAWEEEDRREKHQEKVSSRDTFKKLDTTSWSLTVEEMVTVVNANTVDGAVDMSAMSHFIRGLVAARSLMK